MSIHFQKLVISDATRETDDYIDRFTLHHFLSREMTHPDIHNGRLDAARLFLNEHYRL